MRFTGALINIFFFQETIPPISFHQNSSGLDGLALDSSAAGLPLSTGTKQPVEPESGIKRESRRTGGFPNRLGT